MKKVALIILDGWGHGRKDFSNAIFCAKTPFINSLYEKYSNSELLTSGFNVGLPDGQMGNSEVGHLNLGAGRIVYQDLGKIHKAIADGSFFTEKVLVNALQLAKESGKKVHLMGLLSDGGVHSHSSHLHALVRLSDQIGLSNVYIHAFTDGRDTDPHAGLGYAKALLYNLQTSNAKLATICGRYYAMDRDKRWERIKEAYDLLVNGKGKHANCALAALEESYASGISDEFVKPVILNTNGLIESGDTVICFNFRTDRCREITQALSQQAFPEFGMEPLLLNYVTMTNYDASFKNVAVIYEKDNLNKTLGEVLETAGKNQLRIAETEKYPHVTFFFNGGREKEFVGEKRLLIPSPKVATYDLQPEMSAEALTEVLIAEMDSQIPDFICCNYANPDMVGHTGVFSAVVQACEAIDGYVRQAVECALKNNYTVLLCSDHGNADFALNEDNSPNTAHTTNPVPFFLIDNEIKPALKKGILADVAPTVLKLMGVEQPEEMSGQALY